MAAHDGIESNPLLFGYDTMERIVAVEIESSDAARIFTRDEQGVVHQQSAPFRPFLWSSEPISGDEITIEKLGGQLHFAYRVDCSGWSHFVRLRNAMKGRPHFALGDPVQQFLLQTGKTLFKGMQFGDLRRLQIGMDGGKIALCDNTGWETVIEHDAAERLNAIIAERDPDLIEGHDLFRKILPAITARARNSKMKLTWGRDGSPVESRSSRLQIAEKTIQYPKFEVFGRHFVDTFLLAQFWDIGPRELESYELEDVARHFHVGTGDSTSVEDAMRKARQTQEVATLLSASYFIQAKIFPFNYQDVLVRGNATKIDALLLREYYRRNHSIPDLPAPRPFEGGYTAIFHTGIARNVAHCDVASLYPSVMLRFDCFPAGDQLGIFRGLLDDLRKFRLQAKATLRNAEASERANLDALQATFKILINSFYGYLGFAQGHFADFDAAARVTEIGRNLLKQMVAWLQERGAQVIEIDTDGIYFVPDSATDSDELERGLAGILPEGIEVEFDAKYRAMFSYKAKNYALLTDHGDVIIKGGALKSRGLEKFQRVFLERMLALLLEGKGAEVAALRAEFEEKIRGRHWPIEFLMKTDTLQDSLAQYSKKISGSARNRASAYELALKSALPVQPGDQISYYITGTKKNVAAYENSRLANEWDASARDENVEYYVAKLSELTKKFAPFCCDEGQAASAQMDLI
jgi:DNA polymerase I